MSEAQHDDEPTNNAKVFLPIAILGLFLLICVMYFGGNSAGFYAQ